MTVCWTRARVQELEHRRQRAGDDAEVRGPTRVSGRREDGAAGAGEANHRGAAAAHAAQVRYVLSSLQARRGFRPNRA